MSPHEMSATTATVPTASMAAGAVPTASIATGGFGARAKFFWNVATNIGYMLLSTGVMFWYIPFLIGHLGVAAYGLLPLANSLVFYMAVVTEGFNTAVNRYLTVDLNRQDNDAANSVFNTAFYLSLLLVAAMAPIVGLVIWFFPAIFQVPSGLENEARFIFGCVMFTFFLSVIASNFEVSTLAMHRFDLRNLVRSITLLTRVGTVLLGFTIIGASLWYVGLGFMLSALVLLAGAWLIWKKLTPQLSVNRAHIDRSRLRDLLGMSGWSVVNRLGVILLLSVDVIIINIYFGPSQAGEYGTLILFPELIRNLTDTISSVLNPAILAHYAAQDYAGLRLLASRAVKLMGIGLALPIGLLCGLAQPFLTLWLGAEFRQLSLLLIVLVGHMSITLATLPLSYVLTSYNKVKVQGLTTLLLGVANVMVSLALGVWYGLGPLGVALATALLFTCRNLFFLSSYSAHVMQLKWWTFYPRLATGALAAICVGCTSYGLTWLWPATSWMHLFVDAAMISILYLLLIPKLGLSAAERQSVISLLPPPLQKHLLWIL